MTKFESFLKDYELLCLKHKMEICASDYDDLVVWDVQEDEWSHFYRNLSYIGNAVEE